jgi:probable rRNA maturation factor
VGQPIHLGQIVISHQKAKSQAVSYGHTIEREFTFLFVHGLLHLLGYNHETESDEKIMLSLQDKILGKRIPHGKN